MTRRSFR